MSADPTQHAAGLTKSARHIILWAAFLGWMGAGMQMALMNLASGSATQEFLNLGTLQLPPTATDSAATPVKPADLKGKWFAFYNAAFLFGAAAGGFVFGSLGDRAGRAKAMAASILCYGAMSGMAWFATSPEQLMAMRFATGLGVGGMWPTGVALASEAWSDVSRPMLSGLLGTAANVGIVLMGVLAAYVRPVTVDDWRWILLVAAAPGLLGVVVAIWVPESPKWLAERNLSAAKTNTPVLAVFQPPLLKLTLIGICLGTVPLLGGWGSTSWVIPWSEQVHGPTDPSVKAFTSIMRGGGACFGGLLGGWAANFFGRRLSYFLISLSSLTVAMYIYHFLTPLDSQFQAFVFLLGFVSTFFFGWMPLYLPELFPTHARATGAGVTFNFGRILTAVGVLAAGSLFMFFGSDYARVGQVTSLIFAVGLVVILFAPDTTGKRLGS